MYSTRILALVPLFSVGLASAADSQSGDFFNNWQSRVHAAQDSQPHWIGPIATVSPRLEQRVRYDEYSESMANGAHLERYGAGKGLELIPTETNEILLNVPSYDTRTHKRPESGSADWPFLVVKQRLASANEDNGNYIVTAFLGVQAPTGDESFTNHAWMITPTLAAGKGWGDFDIQATVGVPIPTSHRDTIGTAMVINATLQYHTLQVLWPEIELNTTHWFGGDRDGKSQIFFTPGLVVGRFPLFDNNMRVIVGVGYQYALAPQPTTTPVLTPVYSHAWITSARVAF